MQGASKVSQCPHCPHNQNLNSIIIISGTTFDIDVPFTYNLPDTATGLVFTGRSMEDDHAAVFEMAEDLLNKFVHSKIFELEIFIKLRELLCKCCLAAFRQAERLSNSRKTYLSDMCKYFFSAQWMTNGCFFPD